MAGRCGPSNQLTSRSEALAAISGRIRRSASRWVALQVPSRPALALVAFALVATRVAPRLDAVRNLWRFVAFFANFLGVKMFRSSGTRQLPGC